MLQTLWYNRAFRTQILIALIAISLCALLIAGVLAVLNARNATRIEIEASLEIAKQLVRATVQALTPDGKVGNLSKRIDELSSKLKLANLRHVRIFIADAAGDLIQVSPHESKLSDLTKPPPAPVWFAALVEPSVTPRELSVALADPRRGTVLIVEKPPKGVPKIWDVGTVVIAGEPADEIAEVWRDVSSVAVVWLTLDVLILAVLYLVLGRMLNPLESFARGMHRLEGGQYATRIMPPRVKELAVIAERFNQLAEALDRSRAENARLYGQLITVQEDERREIASELHDEASPCFFGIIANALSVQQLVGKRQDRRTREIRTHVAEILAITDHLNLMNRALLKKLRPVALGRVPLANVINDLVSELQRRHSDVKLAPTFGSLAASYGEAIDLTLYRCIQESVTNAIQHGKADAVLIKLLEKSPAPGANGAGTRATLQLTIEDDGRGLHPHAQMGFGTTVMRERVHALGGSCVLKSVSSQGTLLRVVIPVAPCTPDAMDFEMAHAS